MGDSGTGRMGCVLYIDDVIVYSETWGEHLCWVRALLLRLVEANFTVNLAKCKFARPAVIYLGKVWSSASSTP